MKQLGNMFTTDGFSLGSGKLAEGTNANTINVAQAFDYVINGIIYSKAVADNTAMTACAQQADNTTCLYLITINASGTVKITKGTEVLSATVLNGVTPLELPECPANEAPIGIMKIVLSGGTFTSGTTDLSGTGVTDTFYNIGWLPDRKWIA